MGYGIQDRGRSPAWSLRILLIVAAVIAGLLGMHVLAGHGAPMAAGETSPHHVPMAGAVPVGLAADEAQHPAVAAPAQPSSGSSAASADHPALAAPAHGCADCAEHAAMASSCVLAPVAPAAVPGPPAEDLRPAPAAPVVASAANDPADPRPPSISVLCISRR